MNVDIKILTFDARFFTNSRATIRWSRKIGFVAGESNRDRRIGYADLLNESHPVTIYSSAGFELRRIVVPDGEQAKVGEPLAVLAKEHVSDDEIDVALAKFELDLETDRRKFQEKAASAKITVVSLADNWVNDGSLSYGMAIENCHWLVGIGDKIKPNDELMEFEFGKMAATCYSRIAGTLRRKFVDDDQIFEAVDKIGVVASSEVREEEIDEFLRRRDEA